MALIKCGECGKEMAKTAKACPHCGGANKAKNMKETFVVMAVCWIVFGIFYVIYHANN